MELQKKLNKIQQELKAPKNQKNSFGNYNYRSCEDILEAVKPLLDGAVVTISDSIKNIGVRYYIEAEATIMEGKEKLYVRAYAREPQIKKGMDEAQITGATSSYARKYALNGLFAIDDTKDTDTMDNSENKYQKPVSNAPKATLLKRLESLAGKKLTAEHKDWVIETVEKKSGIRIKSFGDLEQKDCKDILESWL